MNYLTVSQIFWIGGAALVIGQLFIDENRPESKRDISGHAKKITMIIEGCVMIILGLIIRLIGS